MKWKNQNEDMSGSWWRGCKNKKFSTFRDVFVDLFPLLEEFSDFNLIMISTQEKLNYCVFSDDLFFYNSFFF